MIQINENDLKEINKTFTKLSNIDKHKAFKEFAYDVYDDAQERADRHTITGKLFSSIFIDKDNNDNSYTIGVDSTIAPYGIFVHWGTKAHTIKPKMKKSLRWTKNSSFIFSTNNQHPGYKGDPFLILALDSGFKRLPQLFYKITKDL